MSKSTYCGDSWTNCLKACRYAPIIIVGMSYIKGDEESLLATYSCYVELNPYFEDIFELL